MIPYGKQNITEEDILAVTQALKGDFLTQGPTILEFEKKFSSYIGCKYSVAVANGTAALHLCALALDVDNNSKVITTPITFAASANCIQYCGGEVVFSDIDSNTYLIDIPKIKKLLEQYPKGTFKGIIPVDFAGRAVNLEELKIIAEEYNLWIIEDACHAPGGYFVDSEGKIQNCGNGNFADLAIFSFHPVKHIATGEGGMITTNDENLYKKLLMLRTHGITRDVDAFQNSLEFANGTNAHNQNYPGWYMEMQTLGYNYRFTDFQAALGISQLDKANDGIGRRRAIAKKYFESFKNASFLKGQSGDVEGHAYHLYVLEVENRLGLYNYLRENKIFAQIHYIPCHLMPYYRQLGNKEGDHPEAENYYRNCISLPMYPTLSDEEQNFVIDTIFKFYS
ncbi:Pyridoxal-5'-phosphate-dependent protein [Flavobacterium sp. 9AF]|uniref:UDP-4-amino-4, 6-dideoxy-N-acetyl-beta-L-altrosamine transaminase n=1 Tax=Flavobacterium sp. 9AF TaxID=2653142 RepID=UPI0012F3235D|nr:UDP-4-amino-4,6-dideoxy-N-acetyl-beta-L-altrosamine transaminase [Flavobacterium sp. 9AF]VXC13350.1 Pyridoxal-5'-phosphate-dependent protein [Flavobacterium sp. 9AF]